MAVAKIYTGYLPLSGILDLTTPGFGNAAGAYMLVNNNRSDGVEQGACRGSIGFWSGYDNTQACVSHSHNNNAATVTRGQQANNDGFICKLYANTGSVPTAEITMSAISDGVRLNISSNDAARYYMVVVFPASEWSNCTAGFANASQPQNVGYRPSLIMGVSANLSGPSDVNPNEASFGVGIAAENGGTSTVVHSMWLSLQTGDVPPPITDNNYKSITAFMTATTTSNTVAWKQTITITDSGWTPSFLQGISNSLILYFALKPSKTRTVSVVKNNITTGLTTKDNTNFGFTPEATLNMNLGSGTGQEAVRTSNVSGVALWGTTDANFTAGMAIRFDMDVSPLQVFSVAGLDSALGVDPSQPGAWRTQSTQAISGGIRWQLFNDITANQWGACIGISEAGSATIFRGSSPVDAIYRGSDSIVKVYRGSTQFWP